ncbi:MAG: hypothetical protein CMH57_09980 [Myxococcales bacterium]|nr:hypothetical protein [Myxococcales bacterium]
MADNLTKTERRRLIIQRTQGRRLHMTEHITFDHQRIRNIIHQALLSSEHHTDDQCRDIAFHMTDWTDDLQQLVAFFRDPDGYDHDLIIELLTGFFYHVPNHVAAAGKLLHDSPVSDIFQVGAVDSSERP